MGWRGGIGVERSGRVGKWIGVGWWVGVGWRGG